MVNVSWTVNFNKSAAKSFRKLPVNIQKRVRALVDGIQRTGPVQGKWANYSKLSNDKHHCHLTYRYVIVWKVTDKAIKIVEVTYVGSREKAPY